MRLAAPSQLGPRDVYGPAEDGGGAHEAEDALLFTGWIDPTLLGVVFIAGQALIVAAFAELQYMGIRSVPSRVLSERPPGSAPEGPERAK